VTERRASSSARGYNARWQKARATYLRSHPLCVRCEAIGRVTEASVVDHITPHRGDSKLFWDKANWQALCKRCHDIDKQRAEIGAAPSAACNEDGLPTDPRHHWNAGRGGAKV
jgi:5-methylcytosine-specific restriction enzyme A